MVRILIDIFGIQHENNNVGNIGKCLKAQEERLFKGPSAVFHILSIVLPAAHILSIPQEEHQCTCSHLAILMKAKMMLEMCINSGMHLSPLNLYQQFLNDF